MFYPSLNVTLLTLAFLLWGILWLCCLSGSAHLLKAHAHFHCATTVPLSRDLARQALLFLRRFFLSFFVPPILTVFYLIDRGQRTEKGEAAEASFYTHIESQGNSRSG